MKYFSILSGLILFMGCSNQPPRISDKEDIIEVSYVNWACDCADFVETKNWKGKEVKEEDCIFIEPSNPRNKVPESFYATDHFVKRLRLTGHFYIDKGVPASYEQKTEEKPEKARVFRYDKMEIIGKDSSDSLQTNLLPPSRIDSIDISSLLEKKLPLWVSYCKKMMPAFIMNAFNKRPSVPFKPELENAADSGVVDPDKMKYYYIPSPDSKTLLDIYSYRMIMDRDKLGVLHIGGGDPESTIETIDIQNHIWRRIVMAGSQAGFDDACWITNNIFLVVGSTTTYNKTTVSPFFSLYDLKEQRVLSGTWPAYDMPAPENYLQYWKGKKWPVKWD